MAVEDNTIHNTGANSGQNQNNGDLEELRHEIEKLKEQSKEDGHKITELEKKVLDAADITAHHKHEGSDGSARLLYSIDLKAGEILGAGNVGGSTASQDASAERTIYTFGTGIDQTNADGSQNAQVFLEHQYGTDGTTFQTFLYGVRNPLFTGTTGFIQSGGTTLNQSNYKWEVNSLVGVIVTVSDGTHFNVCSIASNTSNQLTINTTAIGMSGGWTFGGNNLSYVIYVPIYLGSADYPWRRIYTADGSAGGIRFGYGPTNGGQNGLLYMSGQNLFWRTPSGSSVQLN